jgi:hypothetical protein
MTMAARNEHTRHRGSAQRSKFELTRLRSWPVMVVLLVAFTALAVACSSDDESPSESTSGGSANFVGASAEERGEGAYDSDALSFPTGAPAPSIGEPGGGFGDDFTNIDLLGRRIIRSASIGLEVDSVTTSFDDVEAIAIGAGGFVADSSFFGRDEERSAQLTLRVPAGEFGDVMTQLRQLAVEVTSINTSAQDVTEEFTDTEAQLSNLLAVEARYLELLSDARGITEILQVQDRIDGVRLQIDRLEGRLRLLEDLTDLATINVSLTPVPAVVADEGGNAGPLHAAGEAWQASLDSIEAVATVAVVAIVYSWWLLPFALVLVFVGLRMRDRITFARDDGGETA